MENVCVFEGVKCTAWLSVRVNGNILLLGDVSVSHDRFPPNVDPGGNLHSEYTSRPEISITMIRMFALKTMAMELIQRGISGARDMELDYLVIVNVL
jgi:hypothetical protein